jgi:ssDNA-binding replication factor A large subunit
MARKPYIGKLGRRIKQHKRQFVRELKAETVVNRLEVVILRVYPRRIIHSKRYNGPLAAACGRDETGIIGLILWGEQIEKVRIGDIVRISSGWCTKRDGELVVSTGLTGQITVIDR